MLFIVNLIMMSGIQISCFLGNLTIYCSDIPNCFFKPWVTQIMTINGYPIKLVDVLYKIYGQSCVTQCEFYKYGLQYDV